MSHVVAGGGVGAAPLVTIGPQEGGTGQPATTGPNPWTGPQFEVVMGTQPGTP